jgi:hypothetical protein
MAFRVYFRSLLNGCGRTGNLSLFKEIEMDIKHIKSLIASARRNGTKTEQAADRLAPLEEQTQGLIIVGEEDFKAAKDLIEKSDEVRWRDLLRLEPVVIVILLVTLGFIAFIAGQIQSMPLITK